MHYLPGALLLVSYRPISGLSPKRPQPLISAIGPHAVYHTYDLKLYFAEIFMLVCILNVCTDINTSLIACVIARKIIGLV